MRSILRLVAVGLMIFVAAMFLFAQQTLQKVALPDGVLEKLNAGNSEYKAADLEAFSIDLNGDGTPEIVVMGRGGSDLCSGSGNCSLWIFGSASDGYLDLVRDRHEHDGDVFDSTASDWKVLDTTHNAYRDLQFFYHDSAVVSTATKYQMRDGKYEYVPGSCETLTYGFFEQGKFHEYNPPKSESCDSRKSGQ